MQQVAIDQLQDVLTRRSLSTAYRMLQDVDVYAVDRDFRVETSCSRSIVTSCVLLKKLLPISTVVSYCNGAALVAMCSRKL